MTPRDLALIVGSPWPQNNGRAVELVAPCNVQGRIVDSAGKLYRMSAPGPVWLVRAINLPGLTEGRLGGPHWEVEERPVCEAHLRRLVGIEELARLRDAAIEHETEQREAA